MFSSSSPTVSPLCIRGALVCRNVLFCHAIPQRARTPSQACIDRVARLRLSGMPATLPAIEKLEPNTTSGNATPICLPAHTHTIFHSTAHTVPTPLSFRCTSSPSFRSQRSFPVRSSSSPIEPHLGLVGAGRVAARLERHRMHRNHTGRASVLV